jgi:arylsulfatase A-like enzyme
MQVIGNQLPTSLGRKTMRKKNRSIWPVVLFGACVLLVGAFFIQPREGTAIPYSIDEFYSKPVAPTGGPNVLVICVDALRPDHTSLYGYDRDTTPQIKAAFADGVVFERAYAPAAITTPSVIGMLSGLYPQNHGVRLLCQQVPDTTILVSDHLRRAGYQTAAIVSNAVLADSATGLAQRFDFYDAQLDEAESRRKYVFERNARKTTDAVINWLHYVRKPDLSHFVYVHYMDPHGPYEPPPDKPTDFTHNNPVLIDMSGRGGGIHPQGTVDSLELIDCYDEEIAFADDEIGRLLREYDQMGFLDDAMVIFCSDHGEAMMEHEHWFGHGLFVYEEMIRVPLAIRYKSMPAERIRSLVSTIDIGPTILEAAGLPVPGGLDGHTLFAPLPSRAVFAEARGNSGMKHDNTHNGRLWRCRMQGDSKVTARIGMSGPIREAHAYDLSIDPFEKNPLSVSEDDASLRPLAEFIAADPDPAGLPRNVAWGDLPGPNVSPSADPETLAHLRSLGYVR